MGWNQQLELFLLNLSGETLLQVGVRLIYLLSRGLKPPTIVRNHVRNLALYIKVEIDGTAQIPKGRLTKVP